MHGYRNFSEHAEWLVPLPFVVSPFLQMERPSASPALSRFSIHRASKIKAPGKVALALLDTHFATHSRGLIKEMTYAVLDQQVCLFYRPRSVKSYLALCTILYML